MVGETNSMVGYHLIIKGHSVQLGSGGTVIPQSGPRQRPDNNNNTSINNIFGVFYKISIKSQSKVPYNMNVADK